MKVNIYETVEISDEQRVQLAVLIDQKEKPKRQATRDEIKEFVWTHGSSWDMVLQRASKAWAEAKEEPPADETDEDLLGDEDDEDLLG